MPVEARAVQKIKKAFGSILREERERRKMTQLELADGASYDMTYISYLESGRYQPSLAAILAFENVLGLRPGVLVQRTAERLSEKAG